MRNRFWSVVFALACILGFGRLASAQTFIVTPTTQISFPASADQSTTFGTPPVPILTNYQLDFCTAASVVAGAPCATPVIAGLSVGKPAPDGTGLINISGIKAMIQPNVTYIAFVTVVGPGGKAQDATGTVPFGFPGAPSSVTGQPVVH
jgi:hypothetical protein